MYAVYGTLRKGWGNHVVLGDSKYHGTMLTPPVFTMYDLGPYPAVTEGKSSIIVEIYEVDKWCEERLFILEGYKPNRIHNLYTVSQFESEFGPMNIFTMPVLRVADAPVVYHGDWNRWKQRSIAV